MPPSGSVLAERRDILRQFLGYEEVPKGLKSKTPRRAKHGQHMSAHVSTVLSSSHKSPFLCTLHLGPHFAKPKELKTRMEFVVKPLLNVLLKDDFLVGLSKGYATL